LFISPFQIAGFQHHCQKEIFRQPNARERSDASSAPLDVSNQGRLATFDSTISLDAIEGAKKQNLELISA
jgi:hypothetical protein